MTRRDWRSSILVLLTCFLVISLWRLGVDAHQHPTKGGEPFGQEAKEANRRLVEGKTVRLDLDIEKYDRYRRLLAYVYVGDTMINAELVRQGYAQVATYPPNVK